MPETHVMTPEDCVTGDVLTVESIRMTMLSCIGDTQRIIVQHVDDAGLWDIYGNVWALDTWRIINYNGNIFDH